MRFNTHSKAGHSKLPKFLSVLFSICIGLFYVIFGLGSFACFYYAKSVAGALLMIMLPAVMTILYWITIRDMGKAYVEIDGDSIRVVDYYIGIKKEQIFSFADITSGEVAPGYSHRVKGYRFSAMGTQYIILRKNKKYLFKIIYLPETERAFKRFLL